MPANNKAEIVIATCPMPFTASPEFTGAVEHVEELDRRITQHAEHWRIERMPVDFART